MNNQRQIERVPYGGLPNCYRLSNGVIDLVMTGDVGIRIIRFGFVGDRNEFFEAAPLELPADRGMWTFYGGHRLWHAPEIEGRTTAPDNAPVQLEDHGDFVRLVQTLDATGVAKEVDVRLSPDSASVELTHRLINRGMWNADLSVWALSVMAAGGTAIIPLPPRGTHPEQLLPTSTLIIWAYVDLSDPRLGFGRKYLRVRQDAAATTPIKLGASVPNGWAAYVNAGHLFVKQFDYAPNAVYPDLGSSVEVFTNADFLEVETLSPMISLQPGHSVEHVERWTLAKVIGEITGDETIDRVVLPVVS